MNYVTGLSRNALEEVNNNACNFNPRYKAAMQTYNYLLDAASEFIKKHAPVTGIILSRYNYNGNKYEIYSTDENTYCLSISYIAEGMPLFTSKTITLVSFKMTRELAYILESEGWRWTSSNEGYHFNLSVKRGAR